MIAKVIYFIYTPFNERDYKRFGIEMLIENGFEVEVWEFTPFLNPEGYEKVKVPDPISYERHHLFLSKKQALKSIANLKSNCFVVSIIPYNYNTYAIYRTLSKNELKYGVITANTLPSNRRNDNMNFLNKLKKITPQKLINALYNRLFFRYIGIKSANLVLAGGEKFTTYNYPIGRNTETLWLHALDYDIYLKEKNNPVQVDSDTGVFLDEYLPFHPDYIHLGLTPYSDSEEYYPLLCNFFNFLEKKYKVKIVIAAHPRSHYEKNPDYFEGRSVIRGRTVELVRKAGFVITHCSTSINFAVLFKKPILFVTTNRINQSPEGPMIDSMTSVLGKKAINLSESFEISIENELIINEKAYKKYKTDYIKKDSSPELPFWQIVANRLKKWEADDVKQ